MQAHSVGLMHTVLFYIIIKVQDYVFKDEIEVLNPNFSTFSVRDNMF